MKKTLIILLALLLLLSACQKKENNVDDPENGNNQTSQNDKQNDGDQHKDDQQTDDNNDNNNQDENDQNEDNQDKSGEQIIDDKQDDDAFYKLIILDKLYISDDVYITFAQDGNLTYGILDSGFIKNAHIDKIEVDAFEQYHISYTGSYLDEETEEMKTFTAKLVIDFLDHEHLSIVGDDIQGIYALDTGLSDVELWNTLMGFEYFLDSNTNFEARFTDGFKMTVNREKTGEVVEFVYLGRYQYSIVIDFGSEKINYIFEYMPLWDSDLAILDMQNEEYNYCMGY